ncbi:hypothetical protein HU200_043205 [Digitaria exilis]|uniref:DUF4220 domain-containing protein n=1 Tax=Digitaria exilis TaxID=1010633 RepID=A0A835BAB8_9POAL|nr:hypothetical protein HU200_043205 [Digitaria exilis]
MGPWLPYMLWLLLGVHYSRLPSRPLFLLIAVVSLLPFTGYLLGVFAKRRRSAVATLGYETNAFADYMTLESRRSPAPFSDGEANNLDSNCKYPLMYNDDGHWVTIKDLLQCDRLPVRNCAMEARDIFLSYSLCRLLARRYYGFHCAEEGNAEIRQLMVKQLLHDHKRAFTIVDVQLAFLHDHFFTSYPMYTKYTRYPYPSSAKEAILPALLASESPVALFFLRPVVPKYWPPIRFAFLHYSRATERVFRPLIWRHIHNVDNHSWNWTQQQPYWRNKIGQYSLIQDYDRRSTKRSFVSWIKNFMLSQVSYSFIKHHPVSEEDVRVPDIVRELVARSLQSIGGPPTNGSCCLKRNKNIDFDDWAWTLRQETHTHTILIWHIATCYCEMFPLAGASTCDDDDLLKKSHEVATALSRYCAYLVAFHPELLPEHSLNTITLLQQVLKEAKDLLGSTRSSMEKNDKIQGLQLPGDEGDSSLNTFQKGIKLGRRLADMLNSVRWKVMAEFWAETVLYVAPSDDVDSSAARIECLTKGGEFVTHIWAMLSNAGILKRATEEWSPRQSEPDS